MGAAVSMLYSGARPAMVHSLIMIDLLKPLHTDVEKIPHNTERALDNMWEVIDKITAHIKPEYTFEELVQRSMKSHEGGLSMY